MGISAGRIYAALDENFGETGKHWATSDAGLFIATIVAFALDIPPISVALESRSPAVWLSRRRRA